MGDLLYCEQESGNPNDAYAVTIKNGANVIGHVPRKLSAACSLFLRLGGTMNCEIIDNHRRYSADLPQGGLEIPCKFVFSAERLLLYKLKKLVQSVPPIQIEQGNALKQSRERGQNNGANEQSSSSSSVEPATKKVKVDLDVEEIEDVTVGGSSDKLWLKFDRHTLTMADMNMIVKSWLGLCCFLMLLYTMFYVNFCQWIMCNVGLLL